MFLKLISDMTEDRLGELSNKVWYRIYVIQTVQVELFILNLHGFSLFAIQESRGRIYGKKV